jgi:DNA-binding NarL/FixJ family response regulator
MPTLLVADDSEIVRKAIRRILDAEPAIVVLGEAETFTETIEKSAELKPDIVLLDLHMPDDHILLPEVIKDQLLPPGSQIKIIGMSLSGDDDEEIRELGATLGACAVLEKARFNDLLIPAILSC